MLDAGLATRSGRLGEAEAARGAIDRMQFLPDALGAGGGNQMADADMPADAAQQEEQYLLCRLRRASSRCVEDVGQCCEVFTDQRFEQALVAVDGFPQLTRDRQAGVAQGRHSGVDNALDVLEQQIEDLDTLPGRECRGAQRQQLLMQFLAVVGSGASVRQGKPLQNALGGSIHGLRGEGSEVSRHICPSA